MDNYSEPMDTITIVADSDEEITKGYSWIAYFVTAEKISNKQVAFSIYTLYFPALDMEVKLAQDSLIIKLFYLKRCRIQELIDTFRVLIT